VAQLDFSQIDAAGEDDLVRSICHPPYGTLLFIHAADALDSVRVAAQHAALTFERITDAG
jgi:hypothetical protein